MHGALFTTPLPLSLIAPSDRGCSICLEPYIEPLHHASTQEGQQGECAVRVELVAEASGPRRCCGHVFGKRCLEAHLRSSGPWKRRCPLCRVPWFQELNTLAEQAENIPDPHAQPNDHSIAQSRPSLLNSTNRERSRIPRNDRGHTLQRPHAQHSASFTQLVREKLKIGEGSDEVGRSLEENE
ncbi:hypothetical protein SVAN01_09693 [Stagonosporopsis vannaccii]|nr:hypothetical protein SVAN01_09693 [Stagonosporopsis vannaccii]